MYKKLIYLVSLILMLSLASTVSADLVAHWQLDDGSGTTAVDSSGNGHDGTLLVDPQWVAGKLGGALEFGGISGQRVEMEGYEGILGTQDRSVMAWVKTTGFGDWISWGQNTNTQKWICRINDNDSNGQVGALRTECSGGYIISTTVLTDGEWHHLASVLESAGSPTIEDIKMYVDGVPEAISGFKPVDINTVGDRNVWIGDGHHDRPLPSVIDDVRIYDHAMTELEIKTAMKNVERIDMEISFAMQPIVIDGQVDGLWAAASTQSFVPLDDPANASGIWKVLYDAENLYVLVDMTDDSLQNDSASSWQDDSVEIYFDGGNTKLDTPLSGDDHQYTFGWTTDEIQGTNIDGYTEGIEHAQVDTDTGWRIEVKMPWMSIWGVMPQAGDLVGIDCYYNDDDDGGDSRENKMLSFSAIEGWNDASQWGTAILATIPKPVDPGIFRLSAYYALDGDPNDSSGNGNNGIISGTENWLDGKIGSALEFDGSTTYVEIPFSESLKLLNQGDFTLSAWFLADEIPPENKEVLQQADANGTGRTWLFVNSTNEIRSYLGGGTTASGVGVEAGVWYHAAVVVTEGGDADNVQLYVNGQPAGEPTQRGMEDCEGVYIIGRHKNPTNFWDGLIDEMQLYNRALTAGELLYLAGYRSADEMDPSLVIYYSFDEVSDIVADQSGKGHDGIVVGDVTAEADGKYGGAANFASGGYLDLDGPNFPAEDIPTSAMTLTAWIKCANTGGDHEIFNARASDETWIMHPEPKSSGDIRWLLRSYGGTTIFQIRNGTMTWDEWLHFAGTYDKATAKAALYINGELIEEMDVTDPADIAGDWGLGARVGLTIDDARPFTGLMDEFRMYTRALSQNEILDIMQGM